jgi:hypothetical protein
MVSHFYSASEGRHIRTTIRVNIPMDRYNGLLGRCEAWRGEYDILKNSSVIGDPESRNSIEISCETLQAEMLLELARRIYPAAAPYIEESIHLARRAGAPALGGPQGASSNGLVKLRDHPLLSLHGTPNWPPMWSKTNKSGNKTITGELGILRQVNRTAKSTKRCYLTIEHERERYLGILVFNNPASCAKISAVLENHIGRSIKEIGDLALSSTL